MKYTKEDVEKKIDQAIEKLRANPKCHLTEEELEERRKIVSTDRSLAALALLFEMVDEKNERP